MKIEFRTNKLKKQCENPRIAQKDFGKNISTKLAQRLAELTAATSLLDMSKIPAARLHKLSGQRKDEYAIDLAHPFRLIIRPILNDDTTIDELINIDIVRIEEVTDYHGK